jgi:hypothetical protein
MAGRMLCDNCVTWVAAVLPRDCRQRDLDFADTSTSRIAERAVGVFCEDCGGWIMGQPPFYFRFQELFDGVAKKDVCP